MKFYLPLLVSFATALSAETVSTTEALLTAVREGAAGATIELAAGTYLLKAPLEPKAGMTITGAGMGETIITHDPTWKPSTATLPDPEMKTKGMDTHAYLFRLQDKAANITLSGMTLRGPQLHGAIFGSGNDGLHLHHLSIEEVLWCGIRTFSMTGAKIHDCEFIDAGGKWKKGGIPGTDGGISAGAIFAVWMKDSEISHNRFTRTRMGKEHAFFRHQRAAGQALPHSSQHHRSRLLHRVPV